MFTWTLTKRNKADNLINRESNTEQKYFGYYRDEFQIHDKLSSEDFYNLGAQNRKNQNSKRSEKLWFGYFLVVHNCLRKFLDKIIILRKSRPP